MTKPIDKFEGDYRFLSNFWPSKVTYEGDSYPTVEHAYQAAKTTDLAVRAKMALAPTPAAVKKLVQKCPIRPDWDKIKIGIMEDLVRQKFTGADKHLPFNLLATEDVELIEGNWWNDTFWGVCKGKGTNHLGKILMKIRKELT